MTFRLGWAATAGIGLILFLTVGMSRLALAEAEQESGQAPIFIFAFAGILDVVNSRDHGILIDWLDDRANRKNEPDLAAMFDALADTTPQDRFQSAFECTFAESADNCQTVVIVDYEPDMYGVSESEIRELFEEHGVSRAWVLQITEQAFIAGYNFSVLAADVEVLPKDLERHKEFLVWHRDYFSKASDAHSRGLSQKDPNADPRIGSPEARAEYWLAGSPPRMERLVQEAPQSAAGMLSYLLSYTEGMTHKQYKQEIKSLDRVRDVDLGNGAKCRAKWGLCKTRVVDHAQDRARVLSFAGQPWMISINTSSLYAAPAK